MNHAPRLRPLLAVLLMALTACAAVPARAGDNLATYKSRFYEIHTNMPREAVIPFGRHMDRVFAAYHDRFSDFRSHHAGPMPLYLLRTQAQYINFMRGQGIDASNSGGMFFVHAGGQGLATWTQGKSRSRTFSVLQHEGFHQFAFNYIGTGLPVWANEGIAQYFEDAVVTDRKMEVGLADAQRIALVKRAIQRKNAVPLNKLVSISDRQWSQTLREDPVHSGLLYAQSWSVVYFLVHRNRQTRVAFEQYLKLVSSGRDSEHAMRSAFGLDSLAPVEDLWVDFARDQKPDPINIALGRLEFLGAAMSYMTEHDQQIPVDLGKLKRWLQRNKFTVTRTSHGIKTTLAADDEKLYQYPRSHGRGSGQFRMLEPAADGLPPRITAPGLDPEPTLIWSRNAQGELVQDVDYR